MCFLLLCAMLLCGSITRLLYADSHSKISRFLLLTMDKQAPVMDNKKENEKRLPPSKLCRVKKQRHKLSVDYDGLFYYFTAIIVYHCTAILIFHNNV